MSDWEHVRPGDRARGEGSPDAGTRPGERGVAMVELAIVISILAFLVIGAIDLGRLAGFQNRMENAAREGGAVVQLTPGAVDCDHNRDVMDRVAGQNPELAATEGYEVIVETKSVSPSGLVSYQPYTGCDHVVAPGERVRVTVRAQVRPSSVITSTVFGSTMDLSRSIEVVVQG